MLVPITIGKRKDEVASAVKEIEERLLAAGFRVKRDDRDLRPGAKYYYWEMRGVPLRLEVGPRDIDAGQVMSVTRLGHKSAIPMEGLIEGVTERLATFTAELEERALEQFRSKITIANGIQEMVKALESGVVVVPWCGERGCADAIEEQTGASVLGTEVRSEAIPPISGTCVICGKEGAGTLIGKAY